MPEGALAFARTLDFHVNHYARQGAAASSRNAEASGNGFPPITALPSFRISSGRCDTTLSATKHPQQSTASATKATTLDRTSILRLEQIHPRDLLRDFWAAERATASNTFVQMDTNSE